MAASGVPQEFDNLAHSFLGRFDVRELVGRGSTGSVYHALDLFAGEDIALKVFDPRLVGGPASSSGAAGEFMREASLVGKLCHPHIAAIREASAATSPAYVAMEYVAGGNLKPHARPEHLLPPPEVMQVGFKACGALDYASKKGIIHRDVKPANMLLTGGTNIKVADFGSARLKNSGDVEIVGSPSYMSPEQIRGRELEPQSDMFSLGVTMYELLTGMRPFVGRDIREVMEQVLRAEPRRPSLLRGGIDKKVDDVLMRMLAKDQRERHPSWADLALDIAKVGDLSAFRQDIPDSERYRSLRSVPLLRGLDDAEIWELVHAGKWRRLPSGSVLVKDGESGQSLFFLARGEAKVTKQTRLLGVLSTGDYFGEMAYIKNGAINRQATVEAITDVVICEFDADSIARTSMTCKLHLQATLLDILVDRLQTANQRIVI